MHALLSRCVCNIFTDRPFKQHTRIRLKHDSSLKFIQSPAMINPSNNSKPSQPSHRRKIPTRKHTQTQSDRATTKRRPRGITRNSCNRDRDTKLRKMKNIICRIASTRVPQNLCYRRHRCDEARSESVREFACARACVLLRRQAVHYYCRRRPVAVLDAHARARVPVPHRATPR